MPSRYLSIFPAVLLVVAFFFSPVAEAEENWDEKKVVDGNRAFALDIYGKLKGREGNLISSPYSISTALAMTFAGARGNTAGLRKKEVDVFLPKFKMTSEFRLDSTLVSMGMNDAFDAGRADFSGMDGRVHGLFVSAVIHKAFVEANEEGTEAAASTGIIVGRTSMPLSPTTFRADHPFVFMICDRRQRSILFLGKVVDPTK